MTTPHERNALAAAEHHDKAARLLDTSHGQDITFAATTVHEAHVHATLAHTAATLALYELLLGATYDGALDVRVAPR